MSEEWKARQVPAINGGFVTELYKEVNGGELYKYATQTLNDNDSFNIGKGHGHRWTDKAGNSHDRKPIQDPVKKIHP